MCLSRRCWEEEADSLQVFMNDEVLMRCDQVKYLHGGHCRQTVELEEAYRTG